MSNSKKMRIREAYVSLGYNVRMIVRHTIEIEDELLQRARRALGEGTIRRTVEKALLLASQSEEEVQVRRRDAQWHDLQHLSQHLDLDVLASEKMWR
jgi:transposase-like protein